MPILEIVCTAFEKAILEYETEMKGKIPLKRQPTVIALRTLLEDAQNKECDGMVMLKQDEKVPAVENIDKSTIYLSENNEALYAYWYAHGTIETAITNDRNQCNQIKNVLDSNHIKKSEQPILFNELTSLCSYRKRKLDSLVLREKMIVYLKTMPIKTFVFLRWFESRLRIKLQAVLDNPHFSESRLSLAERMEVKECQEANHSEINALKSQISLLQKSLINEQAKDNVKKVNELTLELEIEKKSNAFLTKENTKLQQSVDKLFTECNTLEATNKKLSREKAVLQTDYADLQAKYEALLKEKQSGNQPPPTQTFFT